MEKQKLVFDRLEERGFNTRAVTLGGDPADLLQTPPMVAAIFFFLIIRLNRNRKQPTAVISCFVWIRLEYHLAGFPGSINSTSTMSFLFAVLFGATCITCQPATRDQLLMGDQDN